MKNLQFTAANLIAMLRSDIFPRNEFCFPRVSDPDFKCFATTTYLSEVWKGGFRKGDPLNLSASPGANMLIEESMMCGSFSLLVMVFAMYEAQ